MSRSAGIGLMVMLVCSGAAYASGRHENWKAVERLDQGIPVEVKLLREAGLEERSLVSADDTVLTCVQARDRNVDWGTESGPRLVFPRSAIQSVWFLSEGSDRHIWIGAGIGFALGALICGPAGPGPLFACGGVGALIGALKALDAPLPYPNFPPRRPRLHRHLVYRSPGVSPGSVP
jgi:hypothetical protein